MLVKGREGALFGAEGQHKLFTQSGRKSRGPDSGDEKSSYQGYNCSKYDQASLGHT